MIGNSERRGKEVGLSVDIYMQTKVAGKVNKLSSYKTIYKAV